MAGPGAVVGMLTNCSLTNSFNLCTGRRLVKQLSYAAEFYRQDLFLFLSNTAWLLYSLNRKLCLQPSYLHLDPE
nr:hypothetical protein Iba_chr12bCG25970 [Ipomoea batatas]GME11796.1 hypothetical protein Iba_scaffold12494CG0010 [Ipomoea batatas]